MKEAIGNQLAELKMEMVSAPDLQSALRLASVFLLYLMLWIGLHVMKSCKHSLVLYNWSILIFINNGSNTTTTHVLGYFLSLQLFRQVGFCQFRDIKFRLGIFTQGCSCTQLEINSPMGFTIPNTARVRTLEKAFLGFPLPWNGHLKSRYLVTAGLNTWY